MATPDRTADRGPCTGAEQPAANRPLPGIIGVRATGEGQYQSCGKPARGNQTRRHLSQSFSTSFAPGNLRPVQSYKPPIFPATQKTLLDLWRKRTGQRSEFSVGRSRAHPASASEVMLHNVRSLGCIPAVSPLGRNTESPS
jgi:hypothetical protein